MFPFLVYEWSVKEAVSSLVLHSLGSGNPVHLPSIFGTTDAPNFRAPSKLPQKALAKLKNLPEPSYPSVFSSNPAPAAAEEH